MKFLNTIDGADKVVTSDAQQFISKAEKDKLTGIQAGALNNPHPATHPYSMITGTPTSLPADGGNADTVNGFTVGVNVPANAKFTDKDTTYSEITEAEINTGTASTLRTITARRVTFIINKIKGMLTKDDVGLSNVDNTSDVNKPVATITTNGIMSSTDKISLNANTAVRHSHSNKAVLDKFDESGTQLRYNGEVVAIETVYTWAKLKGSMSWGNFLGQ